MAAVATKNPVNSFKSTYIANGANQLRGLAVVKGAAGDGYAAIASAAGAQCIGIQEETTVNAGDPCSIVEMGDAVAIAGAAITDGQYLKTNATGQLVPVVGTAGDGEQIVARAKQGAANAGDELLVFVLPSVL